MIKKQNPGT